MDDAPEDEDDETPLKRVRRMVRRMLYTGDDRRALKSTDELARMMGVIAVVFVEFGLTGAESKTKSRRLPSVASFAEIPLHIKAAEQRHGHMTEFDHPGSAMSTDEEGSIEIKGRISPTWGKWFANVMEVNGAKENVGKWYLGVEKRHTVSRRRGAAKTCRFELVTRSCWIESRQTERRHRW